MPIRQYDKFEVSIQVAGTYPPKYLEKVTIEDIHTITELRIHVREMLDELRFDYANVTGYFQGKAVMITGVRSSRMRKFPVATATRG